VPLLLVLFAFVLLLLLLLELFLLLLFIDDGGSVSVDVSFGFVGGGFKVLIKILLYCFSSSNKTRKTLVVGIWYYLSYSNF